VRGPGGHGAHDGGAAAGSDGAARVDGLVGQRRCGPGAKFGGQGARPALSAQRAAARRPALAFELAFA
jgi:hypothetical protein